MFKSHLDELQEDLLLGDGETNDVLVGENSVRLEVVLVEGTEVTAGVTERSSLNQITARVGVDRASRSELLRARDLEGTSELDGQLALVSLLGNTEHARKHHTSVEHHHTSVLLSAVLSNHEIHGTVIDHIEVVVQVALHSPRSADDVSRAGDGDIVRVSNSAGDEH